MQHEPIKMPPIELPVELWYIVGIAVAAGVIKLAIEIALPNKPHGPRGRRRRQRSW